MLKVCKFGGSSLSSAEGYRNAANIISSEKERKVAVVSAPGKRFDGDRKVTDLLVQARLSDEKWPFSQVKRRFREICEQLFGNFFIEDEIDDLGERLHDLPYDYAVSRGEYFSAKIMARLLGARFEDAAKAVRYSYSGAVSAVNITAEGLLVIPGFYGGYPSGDIKLMARGGSDLTGALAATALGADMYENWTDVSGVKLADPNVVEGAATVENMTYGELAELSRLGAKVMQEEAMLPIARAKIPVCVRCASRPSEGGTLISESSAAGIKGIASRRGYYVIRANRTGMEARTISEIISAAYKNGGSAAHLCVGAEAFDIAVCGSADGIEERLEKIDGVTACVLRGAAMVGVVFSKGLMAEAAGLSRPIAGQMITAGASPLSFSFTVPEEREGDAVRALYAEYASNAPSRPPLPPEAALSVL